MRLERRIQAATVTIGIGAIALVAGAGLVGPMDAALAGLVFIVGLAAMLAARHCLLRRAAAKLTRACDREDADEACAVIRQLEACLPPSPPLRAAFASTEAFVLAEAGRFRECRAALSRVDLRRQSPSSHLLNNCAYALALSGEPERAARLAEHALAVAPPSSTARVRACFLGTLGVARVLAGDCEAGAAMLEQVLAAGGSARHQATRAYYLGEAFRQLSRVHEARAAYARAVREAPWSRDGRRARQRLAVFAANPYR